MMPFHTGERRIWTIWFGILPKRPSLALAFESISGRFNHPRIRASSLVRRNPFRAPYAWQSKCTDRAHQSVARLPLDQ